MTREWRGRGPPDYGRPVRRLGVIVVMLVLGVAAAPARAAHTVSARVTTSAPVLAEVDGALTYTFAYRAVAEVRGAPECDDWTLSVSGADGASVDREGGASQSLDGEGSVPPGRLARLTVSARCTANAHTATTASEETFVEGPPAPTTAERPAPPSRLLDDPAQAEFSALARRYARLAVLACTARDPADTGARVPLRVLLHRLCDTAAVMALTASLPERGRGTPQRLARLATPRRTRPIRGCGAPLPRRQCTAVTRAARRTLRSIAALAAVGRALRETQLNFAASEDDDQRWAHAAAVRGYAAMFVRAGGAAAAAAAELSRRLARARLDVRLAGRRARGAYRAFASLRALPKSTRARLGSAATRVAARAAIGARRGSLGLRSLLRLGAPTRALASFSQGVTVLMLAGMVDLVADEQNLEPDHPARAAIDARLRRLELLCDPDARAVEIQAAASAVDTLPLQHRALAVAVSTPLRTTPPRDRPAGCPEPLPPPRGPLMAFGGFGTEPGRFDRPTDIAIGPGGMYIADQFNSRVQRFSLDGQFLGAWGGRPTQDEPPGDGQFLEPVGVATDAAGNVYVSDFRADRVQKFTADGQFILKWGTTGTGEGQFQRVGGLAVGPDGFLYVVDPANGRIQKFDADGRFVDSFGTSGTLPGQLFTPRGITTNAAGDVFVADRNEGQVKRFSPSGEFLGEWGRRGLEDGEFNGLYDVAFDPAGNLWTADLYNYRLQKFTPDGRLLAVENRFGSRPEDFNPIAVAVDTRFNVYVTDILGGTGDRVLMFGARE